MTRRLFLPLASLLGLAVALSSWRFLALGLADAFPSMTAHIDGARLAFLSHVGAAPVALALGAFQFMPRLRARRLALHRWSGRAYGLAILLGGLGALGMLPTANGGLWAQAGFGLLALFWLATTAQAVRLAMTRRIVEHRRWMIRSYALTFAAVTLRLYLVPMVASGMSYEAAIPILGWLSWLPNLALAEIVLWRGGRA